MSNKSKKWTSDEEEFLKENYLTMDYKDIANELGRTESAISNKALLLKLHKVERYTEEDDQFLLKYYGRTTMQRLCKRLKKSERSIKKRVKLLEGTEDMYIVNGYYQTRDIASITGVDIGTVVKWIKRGELNAIRPNNFYFVNPDAFWKYIKNNIHKCTVRNIDDQVLLTCPEWYQVIINDKKRNYHNEVQRMKLWTTKEIALLRHYLFKGYEHKEIAALLNRTYHSVNNKAKELNQKNIYSS